MAFDLFFYYVTVKTIYKLGSILIADAILHSKITRIACRLFHSDHRFRSLSNLCNLFNVFNDYQTLPNCKPVVQAVQPQSQRSDSYACIIYSSHAMKLRLLTLHLAKAKEDLNRRVLWFPELLLFKWIMSRWELEI